MRSGCLSKPDTPCKNLLVEVERQQPSLIEEMNAKVDVWSRQRLRRSLYRGLLTLLVGLFIKVIPPTRKYPAKNIWAGRKPFESENEYKYPQSGDG